MADTTVDALSRLGATSRSSIPLLSRPESVENPEQISETYDLSLPGPTAGLGKPCAKDLLNFLDLGAVIASFCCLAVSICVIIPSLQWGWSLGLQGQITIVGLLLSIENQCMQRVLPTTFFIIEARWGRSTLQTYDAIIRNTCVQRKTEHRWRVVILGFICLPLGLGVAYKRFLGGISTAKIVPDINGRQYGFVPLTGGSDAFAANFLNAPYLFVNSTSDFFQKSASDENFPLALSAGDKAISYGYNLLLLGNETAAALDLPSPQYVNAIQTRLRTNESWTISADVYGLVSRANGSIESLRGDDRFWETLLADSVSQGFRGFSSFGLFTNNTSFGMIPFLPRQLKETSCFLGVYSHSATFWNGYYANASEPEVLSFRNYTLQFTTRRQLCHATWTITKVSVSLLDGDCPANTEPVDSTMFSVGYSNLFAPFPLDSLPLLVHSLGSFNVTRSRFDSPWKMPSYALAVAASYWARGTFLLYNGNPNSISSGSLSPDFQYSPMNESISSSVNTLQPDWPLYLVLITQPFVLLLLFIFNLVFYSTPIGDGFGLISILAGISPQSLALLGGAGFSGELQRPVTLRISENSNAMQYTLHEKPNGNFRPKLLRKRIYR
ncbi:hypothetical protein F4821DRAFT_243820 [Hypoxylon rubiginosum]|uniref:Uncharacterized protein n=1 Tax=Hypoxylon rubiginosum TaxID=110542 RepID=A0ACC0CU95_9PEZI|nr:hypothetical protein F4821DRAFT_243820 [Hypoxylon rubiginosum]